MTESKHASLWAVLVGPLALGMTLLALILNNINSNDGHLIFSLDDPYIHLAMARNIVENHTWGINPGEFVSTSSSPLFTLTLAGLMLVFGQSEAIAWALAIAGGLLAVSMLCRRAQLSGYAAIWVVVVALYAAFIIGLAELSLTGMEHTLHMCALMAVAATAEKVLRGQSRSLLHNWPLLLAVLISAGLRYETLFLLPPLTLLLWLTDHKRLAIAVGVAGIIPAVALGVFQVAHGSPFLPNTIMVKAFDPQQPGLIGYAYRFLQQVSSSRWIVILIGGLTAIWLGVRASGLKDAHRLVAPLMAAFAVLAHMTFSIDYPRYVGYLIALGVWGLLPWVKEWGAWMWQQTHGWGLRSIATVLLIVSLLLPFGDQIKLWAQLPILGRDIYLQQYQMARFVAEHYAGRSVALNDIGLVAWKGNCRVLDLWGLASNRVAQLRSNREYDTQDIREVTAGYEAPIAIIYPSWFVRYGGVPKEWGLAGYWQINHFLKTNVGGPVVFFYATSEAEAQTLVRNLKNFESTLPPDAKAGY